jgi:hypothetical protein
LTRRSSVATPSFIAVATPPNRNFAFSKVGGPRKPLASFEAAVPSVGMPKTLVSSLPFRLSSWKHATA